jgi:hypothetical protein
MGLPFEGKIGTWTFTALPGTDFEAHGRMVEGAVPIPADPAKLYEAPDFKEVHRAVGFDDGESQPVYGPR